jgi:hypothetical protein
MRTRITAMAAVAGLALAGGVAVGGDAGGSGSGSGGAARPEPAAADVRPGGGLIHGQTFRFATGPMADRASRRLGLTKTRARPGTSRVVQVTDPVGSGLSWAVRTFERPRVTGGLAERVRPDTTRPGIRCAQLGRELDGRFGWLPPGTRTFRPLAGETDLLGVCATDTGAGGIAAKGILIPDRSPRDPDAKVRTAVVWGLAPRGTRSVDVRWAGWRRKVPVRGGTFVALGPAPSGVVVDADPSVVRAGERPPAKTGARRFQQFMPTTATDARIVARLIDPVTGGRLAVLAGTAGGKPCVGDAMTVVAGVVGALDESSLTVTGGGRACQVVPIPRRGRPPRLIGYGGANVQGTGPDLVARERLVPGRFSVTILTPPDVARVEIRTPVEVRTVRAAAPGVVVAVYDGSGFASGFGGVQPAIEITGVRNDGSTIRGDAGGTVPVRLSDAELGRP